MKTLLSKRRFEVAALCVAVLLAALHLWVEKTPVVDEAGGAALLRGIALLEGRTTDVQFRIRGPRAPHPDVLVVKVDDRSAKKYGNWPWSRALVARGIENLRKAGASAVGLDIAFTDVVPDRARETLTRVLGELEASGDQDPAAKAVLASYREKVEALRGPSPDEVLARVLRENPTVVQGVVLYNEERLVDMGDNAARHVREAAKFTAKALTPKKKTPGAVIDKPLASARLATFHSVETPLPMFTEAGHRIAYYNVQPDPDGSLRRMLPMARVEHPDGLLSLLEVETAAAHLGTHPEAVWDPIENRVSAIRLSPAGGEDRLIPISINEPYTLINHVGPGEVFPSLSFADVVDNAFDPARVKGKAVLVGVTQLGNYDQRVTPFAEFEPGVYPHASFLSNILAGSFLTRPADVVLIEVAFIFLAAIFLGRVLPRIKFHWKLLTIVATLLGYLAFDQWMFDRGLHFATLIPALNILVTAFAVIFLGYLSADTEVQKLSEAFQYRVGPKVMREMMAHPEKFKQGGERRELSVLFSDIRGFTSIAERMSPDELSKFINEYLTPMTDIVFETDGTLDKYIGDAVMAFWGAPVDQADHAERACTAALRMLERLATLKTEWRALGRPDFDIGVGINSGPMSVGFMGSKVRGDYTVMGDAVNLASRLEGTNKEYETRILISEGTWELVKEKFVTRRLGAVRVKGKRRPVRIYELRGFGQPQGGEAEAIGAFEAGLEHYSERRFEEAEGLLRKVLALWPEDPPAQRYLEEIAVFKVTPPGPGWDGIYTATTK